MADFNQYFPTLLLWEGGISDDKADKGGLTKYGVILSEWISKGYDKDGDKDVDGKDLKLITKEDAAKIAKTYYWDKVKGDDIVSQSIAELLVDFAYNSGVGTAVKKIQTVLGITADGAFGPKTLAAINAAQPKQLFDQLKAKRIVFYSAIVEGNPSQKVFLRGWQNRVNSFTFKS